LKLAPTLGRVKSSIPHGAWRFYFSSILKLKIEYTRTFISTIGIFCLMKKMNLLKIPQELLV
jgi:hypothetical protein